MDTNKGIKILRIVSLTLGIISMLFFLYTKISHAEESNKPVLPYTPNGYYSPLSETDIQNIAENVNNYDSDYGTAGFPFMLFVTQQQGNDVYITAIIDKNSNKTLQINKTIAEINETDTYVLSNKGSVRQLFIVYNIDTHTVTSRNFSYGSLSMQITRSNLIGQEVNVGYPIYATAEIQVYTPAHDWVKYTNQSIYISEEWNEDEIIGEIQGVFEKTELIADNSQDIASMQPNTMKNWLQGIINTIWDGVKWLFDNFQSFFAPFFNRVVTRLNELKEDFNSLLEKVTAIVQILQQYVANDLTAGGIAQVWETNYQQSFIYTLVTTGNSIKTALSSLGDTEPQAPIITVNLGNNTFFGQTGQYQFEFTWYENMRTPVTTFITAFWLVGLGIHLFTQIPNMIHGVSGTAHGIQNATPTETYSHKDIYH